MAYGLLKCSLLKQISVLYQLYSADFSFFGFFFYNFEKVKLIQSANSCLDTC